MPNQLTTSRTYQSLITSIQSTLKTGFLAAQKALEYQRLKTYWDIGRLINEYAAATGGKAEITERLYNKISRDLKSATDLEFSPDALSRMVYFQGQYPKFPKDTPLTFTHYLALLRISDVKDRQRLEQKAIKAKWSSADLKLEVAKINTILIPAPRGSKALRIERGEPYVYNVQTYTDPAGKKEMFIDCGFKIDVPLSGMIVQNPIEGVADGKHAIRSIKKDNKYEIRQYKQTYDRLYTYAATLKGVVDSDTIDVRIDVGFGIRLYDRLRFRGINAPEISTSEGKLAKKFLEDYLKPSPMFIIRTYKQKEEMYGRWLADIFILKGSTDPYQIAAEGEFLNQKLLDEGLAEIY